MILIVLEEQDLMEIIVALIRVQIVHSMTVEWKAAGQTMNVNIAQLLNVLTIVQRLTSGATGVA